MVKLWAFHLPQFHPIPENNRWWGEGFTEWDNVRKAEPKFPGHRQPHCPLKGYYDLRCRETLRRQAELAHRYGISGFVFYHYWFHGRRLLEKPLEIILQEREFSLPFCLCWANESWTRRWDGMNEDVLISQNYSPLDDLQHISALIEIFKDERYFRHQGRPVLLVYRSEDLPDPCKTAALWRREVRKAGFPDLYLLRVEGIVPDLDPSRHGFDAAVEFAPDWRCLSRRIYLDKAGCWSESAAQAHPGTVENRVFSYPEVVAAMQAKAFPGYKRYLGVFPAWDNSARRRDGGATIIHGASAEAYFDFLRQTITRTKKNFTEEDRLIFINAWNEWGEGCFLEGDCRQGETLLKATAQALVTENSERTRLWQRIFFRKQWP
ncbi:MAG: glycoside hydrolase family 99-like domain-containing protein [Deltaproteobacteria bacterium]|nr:glycoside hydrolase family 99-like domain-containing protein [Deltaproteobacteria bacterium]